LLTSENRSLVRRLWLSDLPAFKAHLHRLDHDTLHDRFGGYASESFLDDYAQTCLFDGSVVYGYFDGGLMRGAGELRWNPGSDTAEAALSVEYDWRHQGIGTELFTRVIRAACNRGVANLSILCLPHNQAMLDLARKFEAELHFESDEITGRLIARRLTPLSLWSEYVEDSLGFVDAVFDAQKQLLKHFLHQPALLPS
jgi:GNAT superfamily N-acetyltransferase